MKNKGITIFLIILLSIISILLLIFMTNVISGNIKFSNFISRYNVSNELIIDETYNIDFNEININTDSSEVYIKESLDNEIKVVIYGDKEHTKVDTAKNKLSIISTSKKCIGFCFNTKVSKVEVYIPNDYNKLVIINNKYGDIEVGKFLNANIKIKEDCGDVSVLGGSIVNINNDYGDIILGTAKKAIINESAGDIEVKDVESIEAKNSYGDIEISKVNEYINITSECGDVEIDNLNLEKNSYIKNSLGDITINNTNKVYFDTKTNLGDTKINNNYNKSNITLKIENDCGDIEINN